MHDRNPILPAQYTLREGQMVQLSPPQPAPSLLTEKEAIRYLRLDTTDTRDPVRALRRYRMLGLLRGTQVGRKVFYRIVELERFLDNQTEDNPT